MAVDGDFLHQKLLSIGYSTYCSKLFIIAEVSIFKGRIVLQIMFQRYSTSVADGEFLTVRVRTSGWERLRIDREQNVFPFFPLSLFLRGLVLTHFSYNKRRRSAAQRIVSLTEKMSVSSGKFSSWASIAASCCLIFSAAAYFAQIEYVVSHSSIARRRHAPARLSSPQRVHQHVSPSCGSVASIASQKVISKSLHPCSWFIRLMDWSNWIVFSRLDLVPFTTEDNREHHIGLFYSRMKLELGNDRPGG